VVSRRVRLVAPAAPAGRAATGGDLLPVDVEEKARDEAAATELGAAAREAEAVVHVTAVLLARVAVARHCRPAHSNQRW
jgi:hypothetical protein